MKLLKISLILALFFVAQKASAFTCTAVAGGGNWNAAGTWSGCNSTIPQAGDDVVLDATSGNVAVNANTAALKSLVMTGYTGTLSGASTITVVGTAGTTQSVIFDGTITWTGRLQLSPTTTGTLNLTTNGKLLTALTLAGGTGGIVVLQDNLSFTAIKTADLTINNIGANILNMNGMTISGNSATNRLLVTSNTLGSQRTINRNGGAFANADFRDIDLEASYNCSAITGLCGDTGGNSADFTFTTSATQTWQGTVSGSWDDAAKWTSRVPLPQDDVVVNAAFSASQAIAANMPRLGKNINFTGVSGSPAVNFSNTPNEIFGSLTLDSGVGALSDGNNLLSFMGRDSFTLTTAGLQLPGTGVNMFGGTLTLQDALTFKSARSLAVTNGTFDANDFNVSSSVFTFSNSASVTINAGNGTWTAVGTGNAWNMGASAAFTAEGSTIVVSNTTATTKTFIGAGKTYNNLTITGDDVIITGNNTFNVLTLDNGSEAEGLIIGTGSTQTVSSITNGSTCTSGTLCLLFGVAAGGAETLSDSAGTNCVDSTVITNITASGGASFYAPYASADGGGNSGWTFSACPVGGAVPNVDFIWFEE